MGGRLDFVAGLYYFNEIYEIGETVNLGAKLCDLIAAARRPVCLAGPLQGATRFDFKQVTDSYAVFGQATFAITETLDFTGGVRYSKDRKDGDLVSILFNPAASVRAADTALGLELDSGQTTYRANLAYRPTRDLMFFATYSTGFKSAGLEASNGATLGMNRLFDPETTTNYEVGAKSELLDRRLVLNATVFRTDIEEFQLRSFNGTVFTVRNAGSIRQQGVEFDVTARPVDGLTLSLAGIRLDSEYTDFRNAPGLPGFGGVQDLTGTRAPFSPKWQGVLSGRYEGDLPWGGLRFSVASNLSFQSKVNYGSDNSRQADEPGYVLLGARVGVSDPDRGWEVYASGENLTDTNYCSLRAAHTFNGPLGLNDPVTGGTVMRCYLGEPTNVRVGARIDF
jgi:iron complex outermembrane receptor protein